MDTIRFLILHVTARFGNALATRTSAPRCSTKDSYSIGSYLSSQNISVSEGSTMDLFKGILVQVISNGEILKSYNDPDSSENENPYQRQEYIEAVTGATFAIKVLITDQFDLRNISRKDGMIVDLIVDGLDWRHGYYFTREEIEDDWGTGKPHICDFDEFTHFSDKTGQWMKSEYSFNALKLGM